MLNRSTLRIDAKNLRHPVVEYDLAKNMRASYYFLGALLGKTKTAKVSLPGGCDLGSRPIDQHLKGFEALGAKVEIDRGMVCLEGDTFWVRRLISMW